MSSWFSGVDTVVYPEWFLSLLKQAKDNLSTEAYQKYFKAATTLYENDRDRYLRRVIEASYAKFEGKEMIHGNIELSLNKVVDVIRYFASSTQATNLYKVKLMKLLWYADALSYKTRGNAITGLVYQALPIGAVPVGHNSLIDLNGVPCVEVDMGETNAYHFVLEERVFYPSLSQEDIRVLDIVIEKLGKKTKNEIVEFVHNEQAYTKTALRDIIPFKYTKSLQI